ncbi:glycosyltransferase family 71 protein [Myriangium duriaei CBS 260.36]|uniref:Glycosyltransferase family 71 protein n=1 Tax=Myriangium duriaei CBS 260.36 TaxID=1168546 RepID=A0A9P4IYY4_9PEZI|nr:glycosyltransferase family 71 protein [Myriangium duriaei CBS 260.36]
MKRSLASSADDAASYGTGWSRQIYIYQTCLKGNPFSPSELDSKTPIADLRCAFKSGPAGIVISCGDRTLRFAAHLISNWRLELGSTLPIQVVYAGDGDLSRKNREQLSRIAKSSLEFLDITTVFNDTILHLSTNWWAIKPFAVLASRFERVILLDADTVFLQQPEVLFSHGAFLNAGALLFHDRALRRYAYPDRNSWWRDQSKYASATLNKSLVWNEYHAEEADSGVLVVDKSRPDIFAGLLHIAWQNSHAVQEERTFQKSYAEKESWWLGFELAGANCQFEEHYGGIVGWEDQDAENKRVCSSVIAHVDEDMRLLWYSGSLLRDKQTPSKSSDAYVVPQQWMIDAQWQKAENRQSMSCMIGGDVIDLTQQELGILTRSIDKANNIDSAFGIE